jgi:DDE superfamily endonuclease
LKPWLNKRWCIGKITGDYIWHMEDVLEHYARPYDPLHPLICYDERPCQILGDVLEPLPMKPGQPMRYDYEYERNGTCCVLLAFEPHTGFRYVQVRARRTAVDYAQFMQDLVRLHYPTVDRIRLVQDNLNTHTPGSFYQILSPEEAFQFAQKFELHYTPKKGSWLNMAEIEFAALATQCLNRRIADQDTLAQEALAWAHNRNTAHKTVNWRFTKHTAREKLKNKYPTLTK